MKVETEDFILEIEHRDFMVFLKATVEVLKTHLRELHLIKPKTENVFRVNCRRDPKLYSVSPCNR